jgi:tripartite-type tricarboxylate transporter receptor subunit TctC
MRLAHCVRASMLSALAALLLTALAIVATAAPTDYPIKPIRIVVGFAVGATGGSRPAPLHERERSS